MSLPTVLASTHSSPEFVLSSPLSAQLKWIRTLRSLSPRVHANKSSFPVVVSVTCSSVRRIRMLLWQASSRTIHLHIRARNSIHLVWVCTLFSVLARHLIQDKSSLVDSQTWQPTGENWEGSQYLSNKKILISFMFLSANYVVAVDGGPSLFSCLLITF